MTSLLGSLSNTCRRIRLDGPLVVGSAVARGLLPHQWRIYRACEEVAVPGDIQIGNLTDLQNLRTPGLPWEFYYDELHDAKHAWLAIVKQQPAAVLWAMEPTTYQGCYFRFAPHTVELGYAYTLPEYRGRGQMRGLIAKACQDLRRDGYSGIYAIIQRSNYSSQRAFTACGFREVARRIRPTLVGPRYATRAGAA